MTSTKADISCWRAFALLAASYFMTVVDFTIVNVSLPTIGRDLRAARSRHHQLTEATIKRQPTDRSAWARRRDDV